MKPILIDLPMPITTPRLLCRPPEIGEGKLLNEAILESFDLLHKNMAWAKEKPTVDESEEIVRQVAANWILKKEAEPYLMLFILDKQTNDLIGSTGFHHIDWEIPSLETGYWVRKKFSGQGYITEALNALTQYAFKQILAKRLTITCNVNNTRSRKIPERLGYELEGIRKMDRLVPHTNQLSDTLVFTRHHLNNLPSLEVKW